MKAFKLEDEPKIETGFIIPENYFENFSEQLMLELPKEETKVISFFQKKHYLIMMAAAVLIIALMIPILNNNSTNAKELDDATLENYLSYQTNMNQYDLISVLDAKDLNKMNTSLALEDKTVEDILISNANLENYILE
ncbi:hypothetical protein [Flavobacterium sp. K5-23]|uniref:hypothetical protein n=1 Tax=Flavobacterium sp. K5-23 TaxID=2746225 RepID=UPI002010B8AB|nr:hypothetical protein [Flavobacterium sp. K5-23]UQD56553.1 hypothetical protein FLAK523_09205 [Flavobacterium sp. K5-23]